VAIGIDEDAAPREGEMVVAVDGEAEPVRLASASNTVETDEHQ
jgi:hypothetical protein